MKKLFGLLLAALLTLSACSSLKENNDMTGLAPLPHATASYEREDAFSITPSLYFYDARADKLAAESREIRVAGGTDALSCVIGELLKRPRSGGLSDVNCGMALEHVELSEEVCGVYLSSQRAAEPFEVYKLGSAIAATVCDYAGAAYTQLFIDGVAVYAGGDISEPFTKQTGSLTEAFSLAAQQESAAGMIEADVVLWFLDSNERYFLPEVRTIRARRESFALAVFEELAQGPKNKDYIKAVINKSNFIGAKAQYDENGVSAVFGKYPYEYTETNQNGDELCTAAVVYTLTGVFPTRSIRLAVDTAAIKALYREEYRAYAGARLTLYMPDRDYSMLLAVDRTVAAAHSTGAAARLAALIDGPLQSDPPDVYPAFPAGITAEDINAVYVNGELVVVDVGANFVSAIEGLSRESEYMMIYSIVDTLTGCMGVKRVLLLSDGGEIAAGTLCYDCPFVANPGVIRE